MKEKKKKLPYIILIFAVIFLMLPFIATLVYSFTVGWTSLIPSDWTLKYWVQALTEPEIWPAIGRGLLISIPPILICNVVVILALYTAVIHYEWMEKIIQTICMIPNSLKGIIIAIPVLSEAAEILGAGKLYAFCRIILPNMMAGILVSSLISLSSIFGDFTILKIIVGNRYETIQMLLYNSRLIVLQYQCVIVVITFVVTWILSQIIFKLQNRKKKR